MRENKQTTTHHILKYIGVFGGVESLKILANLAKGKISAFFLGPFGAGIIAIYMNILDNIRSCTNIGLETAGIQQLSKIDTEEEKGQILNLAKTIRTWAFAIALISIPICLLVAYFFSSLFLNTPEIGRQSIILLVPAAFLAPIATGECAILKGTHRLKRVASVELLVAVFTTICVLVIYKSLKLHGIILAININIALETAIHLILCTRVFPYRIAPFSKQVWKQGIPLLKFGIPYFITAFSTAITTTILYRIIHNTEDIGFYKTGVALIMYYSGVVLSSNSIDYFPRLTSVCQNIKLKNDTVNKQIHATLTITTPLTMAFLLAMPLIVVILYTRDFMPIANMCIMAALFHLHRSVTQPLEYVSLAHGQSWIFLILENIYNLLIIGSVFLFYPVYGLPGAGLALSFVGVTNTIILYFFNKQYYKICVSPANIKKIIFSSTLVVIMITLCMQPNSILRYSIGIPLVIAMTAYSLFSIKKGILQDKRNC